MVERESLNLQATEHMLAMSGHRLCTSSQAPQLAIKRAAIYDTWPYKQSMRNRLQNRW